MNQRQFFLKCSVRKDIIHADFSDRLKHNSWEIIGSQASLMIPLELLWNINLGDVNAVFILRKKITF